MLEPIINNLEPTQRVALDEITILSNEGGLASENDAIENDAVTRAAAPLASQSAAPEASTKKKARKKRSRGGPVFLQEAETDRLFRVIKAAGSVRDVAIFRLAYHAGLRASEVGMLDMRDYNPRVDRMFVHRLKGSNSGEHHLCREESRALKAWLKLRGAGPGPIFPSKKRSPISRQMLHELMHKYAKLCGFPQGLQHFHVLKHTCCTHLLSRGFNIEQVQDWVGHARIQNTQIYARITNARRTEMAKALKDSWK